MQFFKSSDASAIDTYINSDVYMGLTTQEEGIDLRVEMRWLLYGNADRKPKGHWVIYRRYNRASRSQYYNKRTHEGVGGPAYEYTDTLLRTRRVPIAFKGQPLEPIKLGQTITDRYIYYLEYSVTPKRGDHIIELNIADHTNRPIISKSIMSERFLITGVHPYRLENGNVQYYSVQAEYDEVSP